ncbi:cyclic nucleotide-gated ion channel 1-like [Rosa rugosa]|uniref:cyclic nucleotide-gated ion channel 1-like n=1 Tax=Rosa rugosa TaxID=74645 RepID=UPI002B403BCF|nr:cyclic nucleotide-gated ion channel 1-like [Rosa rugosa]XP_061998582.1 cyclic nucleotide-gated ion channel 1-like [Rosa rugosa]
MNGRPTNDAVAIELRIIEEDGVKRTTVVEKLIAETHKAKNWWNTIFIISCAFAVFNDPIFCYITAIDNENKCYTLNQNLAVNYVYARTVTDVFYLLDFFISKCGCCCCSGRGKRSCKSCTTNTLSILSRIFVSLPIAQIYAAGGMNADLHPFASKYLFVTSLQYTLRIYYIHDWLKRRPIIDINRVERWVRPILGFVPFILASHLFGAFWYLLATRRQLHCWELTRDNITFFSPYTGTPCADTPCTGGVNVLSCARNPNETYSKGTNISLWDDLCPVKEADPKAFDFGIYFYALQSDVVSPSHHLLQRVFQSFWWALRNLSSFGSNLLSGMDTLEIFFSVLISTTGMALFLVYLNARVQESKDRSNKLMLEEKKQLMTPDIDLWLSKYYLSKDKETEVTRKKKENLKVVIMENIHKLKENSDLDVQNILGILPRKDKQSIMLASLEKVTVFQTVNEKVLKAICQRLVPLTYTEDSCIVQEGKPLGKMLLFIQGTAVTYSHGETSSDSSSNKWLEKGDFYGDELLNWAFKSPSFSDLPISRTNVIAHEKVEAFAIRAKDLKSICFKFWWFFSREVNASQLEQWEHLAASSILATWRSRQARIHLAASYVPPTRWFRRRARTKSPTHWNRFVVN